MSSLGTQHYRGLQHTQPPPRMDSGGLSLYLGAGRAGEWVQGREVLVVNKIIHLGWEVTVEETELSPMHCCWGRPPCSCRGAGRLDLG